MGIAKIILNSILGIGNISWKTLKVGANISYSLSKNTIKGTASVAKKTVKNTAKETARVTRVMTKRYARPIYNVGSFLYPIGEAGIKVGKKVGVPVVGVGLLGYFVGKPIKDYVDTKNEEIRNTKDKFTKLEFNNYLNTSYFTFKASTERQRAQNILDQSNFSGRELLGTEAEHYA